MDATFQDSSGSMDRFNFCTVSKPDNSDEISGDSFNYSSSVDLHNLCPTGDSASSCSSSNSSVDSLFYIQNDFAHAVLEYINNTLMEEEVEGKPCMFQDCIALQATEKSLYETLFEPSSDDSNSGLSLCSHQKQPLEPFNANRFKAPEPEEGQETWTGRKNHQREDGDALEGQRRSKHTAISSVEEFEECDVFKEIFTSKGVDDESYQCPLFDASLKETIKKLQENGQLKVSSSRKTRAKNRGDGREMVDLWTLLMQCAQAISSGDQKSGNELLAQIRQHSSPFGDGDERLAHYFANGLEARLTGSFDCCISSNRISAADILRSYKVYVTACPFRRITNAFGNRTIAKLSQQATRLHIIDFGISYGLQWPCLIHRLSTRPGGPPKLRITGIDLPQQGFRPAERIEATMRRLKRCCETVDVPFEYSAIAKRWETIQLEDLDLRGDELVVVNCMYRLRHLPDDAVVLSSPRDTVLKLIRRINPDMFIHGIVNGTYNVPFFATRFKEALFHFSTLFDILEENLPREDEQRLLLEKEMFGRDAMSVVACEGLERFDRPETYRQWQRRNHKAGFVQLPLEQSIIDRVRDMVKSDYNKKFFVDVDRQWMLQGWKGRVVHAISCWKPVR